MRKYKTIARIIAISLIKSEARKSFEYLSGYVEGLKKRKAPKTYIEFIIKIKNLKAEGLSIKRILEETQIDQPEVLAQNILDCWIFPDQTIIFDKISKALDSLNSSLKKEIGTEITLEEFMLFAMTNMANALRLKMEQNP